MALLLKAQPFFFHHQHPIINGFFVVGLQNHKKKQSILSALLTLADRMHLHCLIFQPFFFYVWRKGIKWRFSALPLKRCSNGHALLSLPLKFISKGERPTLHILSKKMSQRILYLIELYHLLFLILRGFIRNIPKSTQPFRVEK